MTRRMLFSMCLLAASCGQPALAVNKCTAPDGRVTFQDAPCTTALAERLTVRPAAGAVAPAAARPPPASSPATSSTQPPAPTSTPTAAANRAPQKSALDHEADTCLAWYLPLLRDPAHAYYTEPRKDGRVLTITVHATNGYGGYVTKPASCEFKDGILDHDWTKIHADRGKWGV